MDRSKPDIYVSLEIESNENGLSKGEVEILKSVTGLNDDTIHQWFENFKNENPNGLTPIVFRKLYQKYFSGRFSLHFCDHIFRTMDTGNSFSEALILASINKIKDGRLFVKLQV